MNIKCNVMKVLDSPKIKEEALIVDTEVKAKFKGVVFWKVVRVGDPLSHEVIFFAFNVILLTLMQSKTL